MSHQADNKQEILHADQPQIADLDAGVIDKKGEERDVHQLKSAFDNLTTNQAISTFRKSVFFCTIAGFAAATDGYQHQLTASIIANKGFVAQFATVTTPSLRLDPKHVSAWGGVYSAGQVFGQFGISFASERFGRKGAMWVFMALLTLAAIVESVSSNWWHWLIAKLLAGVGIGAVQATLPVYINEHAPAQIRGLLIVAYSLWFALGNLMSNVTLKAMGDTAPNDWKTPIYTQFGMIGASLVIFLILPESAWWLVGKGRMDRARKVLVQKYGKVEGYDIDHELSIMEATVQQQREWALVAKAQGPLAMLTGLNLKRFLIGSWPKVLQQFVGLSIFSSYSAYFFSLAGNKDPFSVTVILKACGLAAVVFDAVLVDRLGRRLMTMIGFGGACFGVTLMAIIGCLNYETPQLGGLLVFAGVSANFFNTVQSSTSYAYLTEMPEERFRARATGWGLAYCNLYAVMFSFTVPLMLDVWQVKAAFLFVALGVPGTVLAWFIMPESSYRSSAEIHEMFVDKVPLRKWKGYKTAVERELEMSQVQGA